MGAGRWNWEAQADHLRPGPNKPRWRVSSQQNIPTFRALYSLSGPLPWRWAGLPWEPREAFLCPQTSLA